MELRGEFRKLAAEYHVEFSKSGAFEPGCSPVPVSGKVFDSSELEYMIDACLDLWLTAGRFAQEFEREFARWMGVRHCLLVNSGSSANLVALSALTSPVLGSRKMTPGDEVITCAVGFPTTVNAILQNGLVPVFVDVEQQTYNIDTTHLEDAVSSRTKAILLAHTLGNPFNIDAVMEVAKKHNLFVIEDACDAVGAEYRGRKVGTFGDLATVSFYPAHHLTMGEGGAVLCNSPLLKRLAASFRDWGRDCWCEPGVDNTCGKRFDWEVEGLPFGYDHKYIYSHIGYNLKVTDLQAAVGVAQLQKLDGFVEKRRSNFAYLHERLQGLETWLVLPSATEHSRPSWFGYPLTVRRSAGVDCLDVIRFLESRKIATRRVFGGNLLRQPAYADVPHRIVGQLKVADVVTEDSFWVGIYPGLGPAQLDYIADSLRAALA